MRLGENNRNLTELEKLAGQKAARTLRADLRYVLQTATHKRTGTMLKAVGATARMKYDALDAITIKATRAVFMQHYGFEGIKKNGVHMSLKSYGHFDRLFHRTKALDILADEIGELRGEEVTTNASKIILGLSDVIERNNGR